jgi:hypothetical protein
VFAAFAFSGGAAPSAQASLTPCSGSNISGAGTSLQRSAEAIWTSQFNVNTNGCVGPGAPVVTYTSTQDYNCQDQQWGGDGVSPLNLAVDFCGTDGPPFTTEITNMNAASRGGNLTIPVLQSALAIVVNPPSGCSISTISAANLELVFRGSTTTWSSIGTGTGCAGQSITRVVRNDTAGTTYELKHYLFTVNSATVAPCSPTLTQTWADLQAISQNTTWPCNTGGLIKSESGCPSSCLANSGVGEGDEAKTVGSVSGSIGYASLSDARAAYASGSFPGLRWVSITGASRLAINPSTNGLSATAARSNCTTAARSYGGGVFPTTNASWSGIYLTAPGTGYPICTLSYILANSNYRPSWGAAAGVAIATTVCDYLKYVNVNAGGVLDALSSSNDYQVLPTDVQTVAAGGYRALGC